jgi:hypothetical protein
MGNISERRKLKTATEFRVKAISLRTVAAELKDGPSRDNILTMAAAWDAKAEAAEANEASGRPDALLIEPQPASAAGGK